MSTCKKCGKEIPEDSVFCPFCGNTVELGDTTKSNDKTTTNDTAPSSISNLNQADKKPRKKVGWIIAIVIIFVLLVPVVWLYHGASHYASPIPQLNAACAQYISDYYNLKIGMSYSEVKGILGDSIFDEYATDKAKYIYTKDKINFGFRDSDYEMCIFVDDKLYMVCIAREDCSLNDDEAVEEHFSSVFGDAYHKSFDGGYYDGKSFDIEVEYSDYHSFYGLPVHTINVCFQSP